MWLRTFSHRSPSGLRRHICLSHFGRVTQVKRGIFAWQCASSPIPRLSCRKFGAAVRQIDANVPIGEDMSMIDQIDAEYMPVMLSRSVISYCGIIALGLSAVGLFSVLTYFVRTRTREIGIRMALGAQISSVLRLIVGQGLAMALGGIGAGIVLAAAAARLLAAWLYGVQAMNPEIFLSAAGILLVVALAASYLPAARAARVDPIIALRHE